MANEDIIKLRGTINNYKDDRGGANLYPHPIVGIVKNNIDPLRTGKIEVYLDRMNGANPDNPLNWTPVSYMSPFFGYTPNTGSPDDEGTYLGNRNSYGFWATPPDIGTQVVCIFINGQPDRGYYIGGIPLIGLTHMVPAIGASPNIIPNDGEANSYAGADRLPVTEYNDANPKQDNSSSPIGQARPVHSFHAATLNNQGLIRDPDRGPISSSSQRESPSKVFGISTPGRPIYKGGYTNETIGAAIKDSSTPNDNFKVVGRTGGHTFVMDDGDLEGRDQLMRLRTSGGHMVLMNDYAQTLFIVHANGQSYIELGKEGTVDIFTTNSFNVRTQGDINLHADNNVNIKAAKDLNISADNINIESMKNTSQFVGEKFKQFTKGDHTVKVKSKLSMESTGETGIKSGAEVVISGGPNVHLNTKTPSLVPEEVKQIPIIAQTDTLYDSEKGYNPAPGKLETIVSRAPAHSPWANANQGVDVKVNASADANMPAAPSPSVTAVNAATSGASFTPTTPALAATVPSIPNPSTNALVSAMAVNTSAGPAAAIALAGSAGVVSTAGATTAAIGNLGLSPKNLENAGILKPGASNAVTSLIASGKSLDQALPTNLFTGKDGISSLNNFINNPAAQVKVGQAMLTGIMGALKAEGVITGAESPTQTGGLVLSAATVGLGPTLDFAKTVAPGASGAELSSALANASANPLVSSAKNVIASGNLATGMADKATGALGGISVADNLKGLAAGAFSKIIGSFKTLTGGKPQNLLAVNTGAAAESAATATTDAGGMTPPERLSSVLSNAFGVQPGGQLRTALEGGSATINAAVNAAGTPEEKMAVGMSTMNKIAQNLPGIPGIPGIPGGLSAVTNIVTPGAGGVPGTEEITKGLKDAAASISGQIPDIGSKINSITSGIANAGGLTALAASGLPPGAAAELQGAISSLGAGGQVKAPTVGADTFDVSGLLNQAKNLLGDSKIPIPNLGAIKIPTTPLDAGQVAEYNKLKAEADKLNDESFDTRKAFWDARYKFGVDSTEALTAEEKYKAVMKKLESVNQKMANVAQGGMSA